MGGFGWLYGYYLIVYLIVLIVAFLITFCVVFRLAFLYVDSDCLCYVTVLAFWFGILFYGCVVACESAWCLIL